MQTTYVAGFLFDEKKQKVVLIKKKRPDWQAGKLNGIGGHIEGYEMSLHAMIREFKEETGLLVENWKPFLTLEDVDHARFKVHFFKAFIKLSELKKVKQTTDEEIIIINVSDLKFYNLVDNLNWLIPMALDDCIENGIIYHL